MRFGNPLGLLFGLLAIPIIALHMLRPRRPSVDVSSTMLWKQIVRPVSSAVPWQPLRWTTLLVLQLLAVGLLAVAVARPVKPTTFGLAKHTVFIIDASASMGATDRHPDRVAFASKRAIELRRQLPVGGVASVVVASDRPHVSLSASADPRAFAGAVNAIRPTTSTGDLSTAFLLAESLEAPGSPIGFVLLSDGQLTTAEKRLLPPGTHYEPIGTSGQNQAITQLVVEGQTSSLRARVITRNFSERDVTRQLHVDVDGTTAKRLEIKIPANGSAERVVELPAGDRISAGLDGADLLSVDDNAYSVARTRTAIKVGMYGAPEPFVTRALKAIPGVNVTETLPQAPASGFDLAVYNQVAVPAAITVPTLAIAAPGGLSGVAVKGSAENPVPTLVRTDNTLLRGLDLSDVAIADAQVVSAPTDDVLVASEQTPLILRGSRMGHRFIYLAFAVDKSNFGVQVAFPILMDRVVAELTATAGPVSLTSGQTLPIASGQAAKVEGPAGIKATIEATQSAPIASRPGFWTIHTAGVPDRTVAVNPGAHESTIAPVSKLPVPPAVRRSGRAPSRGQQPLLAWVVAIALLILAAEWFVSRRSRGVPNWQWRAAIALRLTIIFCLLAALAGIGLPRFSGRVATIFAVDASESMGDTGRQAAVDWVKKALEDQPDSALAGVISFGGDARLELAMQQHATLITPSARIDPSRTDLARALRLAGAVLPSDAKRRVVVVSDGVPTEGDAATEARRLASEGIRVDVVSIKQITGPDAAVTKLKAPARAAETDSVDVTATAYASKSGPARVTLRANGVIVEEKAVDLKAGDNTVDFKVPAGDQGILRLQVEVTAPDDSVPGNDSGFAAVRVTGANRVLVVEGTAGEAQTLAAALQSSGLNPTTIAPSELPSAEDLSTYQSVVFVDVEAAALSAPQTSGLQTAVRDLGVGLVTIGGDRSYALGGYRDSELERLLPVESEIKDPKRKMKVAEVLAIDNSESMSACHCSQNGQGNFGGNRAAGGVNKTDIAQAAASRALSAMSRDDEVGVLAFNEASRWLIPLQQLPSDAVIEKGLAGLKPPGGGTAVGQSLAKAAEALRSSNAKLRHIILFTDGFTNEPDLVQQARALADEGITVSVLATGEGPIEELKKVAEAGRGRFYPGRNLSEIPRIMMEEAVLASRNFVNEGRFLPKVTAATPVTASLESSPDLLGFIATTAKPASTTSLSISDDDDPLLATWQTGLGRVTSWTSDASRRWSQLWASWGGYAPFWASVVKDTFSATGSTEAIVTTDLGPDDLAINLQGTKDWPEGAIAEARISSPDGQASTVALQRTSATDFSASTPLTGQGTYTLGVTVRGSDGSLLHYTTALVSRAWTTEYAPAGTAPSVLARVATLGKGRADIKPASAFDPKGLPSGRARIPLTGLLLALAALAWPIDIAMRRLVFKQAAPPVIRAASDLRDRGRKVIGRITRRQRPEKLHTPDTTTESAVTEPVGPATSPTVARLLARKRGQLPPNDDQ